MIKKLNQLLLVALVLCATVVSSVAQPKKVAAQSLDNGKIQLNVMVVDGNLYYSVDFNKKCVLKEMPIAMTFSNGVTVGRGMKKVDYKARVLDNAYTPPVRVRAAVIEDKASELTLKTPLYDVIFRLYDDAVAYRVVTKFKEKEVRVMSEEVCYNFTADDKILFPEEKSMYTHQERKFIDTKLTDIADGRFCSPPMLATDNGVRMLITEVDLQSYPGIYYNKSGAQSFQGTFPHYALETQKKSDRNVVVTKAADYLAVTSGARSYPWRVALITDRDEQLIESLTLSALAAPSQILGETSWIRPGKIAWDWWNGNNLKGVSFQTGINTDTYKYFIDFAAANNLEYVVLDEGWYDIKKGITSIVPTLDMDELVAYAKAKNVDLILWMTWLALEENTDAAFEMFKKWDIKGLKIDFMQRDDQWMVDWYHRIAQRAFDNKMLVDYHGAYTPRGLNLTFPNMMTTEGVYGGEQNKWTDDLTPEHNVTLAFTRMAIGPIDYTPGAMTNATQDDFVARFVRPMSLGTRCHQLGMYVVYESPLQMLCDTPTAYEKEPECMEFLSAVPAVWDETKVLKAAVGDYVVVARRSGDKWYVGAMTDWTGREIEVPLSFLGEGQYKIKSWSDGINVATHAEDFQVKQSAVNAKSTLRIPMASGGGYAAVISR